MKNCLHDPSKQAFLLPCYELLTHSMALSKTNRKPPEGAPFTIRSLSITPEDAKLLDRFSQNASDYLGWTVSGSAIMRGLLRHADQQGAEWMRENLFPFIEHEIQSGRVWGRKK
jgi:hypothetical protein